MMPPKPAQLHVTVIRHAETNSNLNRILQGHIDVKLNKTGREQADLVAKRLQKIKIDHIYTSDLSRAKKTADAICKYHPDTPVTVDERIRERDLGRLSGLSIYDALELIKNEELTWDDYGEPKEDFKARVVDFFDEMVANHLPKSNNRSHSRSSSTSSISSLSLSLSSSPSPPSPTPTSTPNCNGNNKARNPHILIVTHGGTIKELVKEHVLLDLGFRVNNYLSMKHKAKNSSVTKFVVRRRKNTSYFDSDDNNNAVDDYDDSNSVVSSGSNSAKDDEDTGSEKALCTSPTPIKIIGRKTSRLLEGEVTLWSCVSHLSAQGKRTHGDSQID
ncbi:22685_t:CDS:2, partial [Entrophospora sp. SA101]